MSTLTRDLFAQPPALSILAPTATLTWAGTPSCAPHATCGCISPAPPSLAQTSAQLVQLALPWVGVAQPALLGVSPTPPPQTGPFPPQHHTTPPSPSPGFPPLLPSFHWPRPFQVSLVIHDLFILMRLIGTF